MKKTGFIVTLIVWLLLSLLASACSAPKPAGPTAGDIFTEVAITLTAQAAAASPTPTVQSSPSPTVTAPGLLLSSPTSAVNPTGIPPAPTQTVVYVAPTLPGGGCNNSLYISDVTIPDGTVLAPGQAFVKTWQFQNSGTCAWSSNYQLIYSSGSAMNGSTTPIAQTVNSGSNANLSVSLTAPASEGTYTGYWRLADANGNAFGALVYVQIKVSKSAATLTPTPTITSTGDTSTPTDTSEPAEATATRTRTSTRTHVPSSTPTLRPSETGLPTATYTPIPSETPEPTQTPTSGN